VRIGVFGGTFDPPHVGHLLVASDAAEALALDLVLFVPAATQPLKANQQAASPADRLAMVDRLVAGDPRFAVEPMELERGGLSFTVDTLRALRDRYPAGTADLVLLLGADAAAQFSLWRDPDVIRRLAEVVVLRRGEESAAPEGFRAVATRRVDISSSEIRDRVRAGRDIRGFVTDPVAAYIARAGLYRQRSGDGAC
jgi:nicotinate-nucleotide adenylyltransferase